MSNSVSSHTASPFLERLNNSSWEEQEELFQTADEKTKAVIERSLLCLPNEALFHITRYLPSKAQQSLAVTCTHLNACVKESNQWESSAAIKSRLDQLDPELTCLKGLLSPEKCASLLAGIQNCLPTFPAPNGAIIDVPTALHVFEAKLRENVADVLATLADEEMAALLQSPESSRGDWTPKGRLGPLCNESIAGGIHLDREMESLEGNPSNFMKSVFQFMKGCNMLMKFPAHLNSETFKILFYKLVHRGHLDRVLQMAHHMDAINQPVIFTQIIRVLHLKDQLGCALQILDMVNKNSPWRDAAELSICQHMISQGEVERALQMATTMEHPAEQTVALYEIIKCWVATGKAEKIKAAAQILNRFTLKSWYQITAQRLIEEAREKLRNTSNK